MYILRYLIYKDIYNILEMNTVKFLQSMDEKPHRVIEKLSEKKSMSVQNFIRFIILPEWAEVNKVKLD